VTEGSVLEVSSAVFHVSSDVFAEHGRFDQPHSFRTNGLGAPLRCSPQVGGGDEYENAKRKPFECTQHEIVVEKTR